MKKLKQENLEYLKMLLESGLSISQALDLLIDKDNEEIVWEVKDRLSSGEIIESIIKDYVPKGINDYLAPLLNKLSFSKSLALALDFNERINKSQKELINKCIYPIAILFLSITALFLFDILGLDTIFGLLESFNTDLKTYRIIRILIRVFIFVFYISILFIALIVLYMSDKKRIIVFYMFITKYFKDSLFNLYYSHELISLYLICLKSGYKSKDSFLILKSLTNKPILSFLAFHLDETLNSGAKFCEAFNKDIYDSLLTNYIKIASYTLDFDKVMKNYVELTELKIKNRLKKYTNLLEGFVYLFVGMVIVFVYQILYLPMSAIGTF